MKILIADDHGIVREGLRSLIAQQGDMEVVGEAEDGATAVRLSKELFPDVVIMDVSMPNLNGIDATRLIVRERPNTKIIALSMHVNKYFVVEMLKAGALGYVLKSCLFEELVRAIHAVSANEYYLSPRITTVLVDGYIHQRSTGEMGGLSKLTVRERQTLQLLAEGRTVKQIALHLNISPKTADADRRRIMGKIGVSNMAELTKYAIREGLTSVEF